MLLCGVLCTRLVKAWIWSRQESIYAETHRNTEHRKTWCTCAHSGLQTQTHPANLKHSCWEVGAETNCPVNITREQRGHPRVNYMTKNCIFSYHNVAGKETPSFPCTSKCTKLMLFILYTVGHEEIQLQKKLGEQGMRSPAFVVTSQWQAQHWVAGAPWQAARWWVLLTNVARQKATCIMSESSGLVTSLSFSNSLCGSEDKSTFLRRYQAHCSRRRE